MYPRVNLNSENPLSLVTLQRADCEEPPPPPPLLPTDITGKGKEKA